MGEILRSLSIEVAVEGALVVATDQGIFMYGSASKGYWRFNYNSS